MPSLFRFLFVILVLTAGIYGGLWFLAEHHQPQPREVSKVVPGIKIRRE